MPGRILPRIPSPSNLPDNAGRAGIPAARLTFGLSAEPRGDIKQSARRQSLGGWKRRWKFGLIALVLAVVARCSVADLGRVSGGSMRPTLWDGDRIVTNKLAYGLRLPFADAWALRWSGPRRGEVVVLFSPLDGQRLVKRVVAVPGDPLGDASGQEEAVPPGQYFVQGDCDNSLDSRTFGCVRRERILGRVVGIAFSLDGNRSGRPRWGRFFRGLPAAPANGSRVLETVPSVSQQPQAEPVLGQVGRPFPGVEFRPAPVHRFQGRFRPLPPGQGGA